MRPRSRPVVRWFSALTAVLLVAGCGSQASRPAAPPSHASAASTAKSTAKPPAPTATSSMPSVRVGYCCPSTTVLPIVVGLKKGLFKKAGVNVHFQHFLQGTATVVQALSAGQLDIGVEVGGPDTILRAARKGAKIKMVAGQETLIPFWLYAKPSIHSIADLRGKTVVFGGLGGPAWTLAAVMLASGGLTPKDVQVIQNGNDGQRLALLLSGRADAAALNLPENFRAQAKGFHQLVYIGKVVPSTIQVMAASDRAIRQNREGILRFMKGEQAAMQFIQHHTAQAAKIYQGFEKLNATQARKSVAINSPLYTMRLTGKEMVGLLKMDQKVGMWKSALPSMSQIDRYADFSFLRAMHLHA